MAKLLIEGQWFEGLASSEYYEAEFEALIAQDAERIFPGWNLVPFKVDVESPRGRRRPDYALIDRKYRCWWVVEVEMAHHSLESHVLPQIEVFWEGDYGSPHVEHILRNSPTLDRASLESMMLGTPPRVYVVVNMPCPEWRQPLAQYGVEMGVVEIFRSDRNTHALRLNGYQPEPPRDSLTLCRRDPTITRYLTVESPAALPIDEGATAQIEVDGRLTEWVRMNTASRVYLCPRRGSPLGDARSVELQQREDGTLVFVRRT